MLLVETEEPGWTQSNPWCAKTHNIVEAQGHILTKDRKVWRAELQRHCGEVVYDDKEETAGKQEERIRKFKTAGDTHFTEDGILAEMSVEFFCQSQGQAGEGKKSMRSVKRRSLKARS